MIPDLHPLDSGWTLSRAEPGLPPGALATLCWEETAVPGTIAQALDLPFDSTLDLDAVDWWYRCRFRAPPAAHLHLLRFLGLATLCEAWLNGSPLFRSENMFRPVSADVTALLQPENELFLCFRALGPALAARRPRPRWKTALVEQQNLRWLRTTLLGRIPAWTPRLPPVGPFRPVVLESWQEVSVHDILLQPRVEDGLAHLSFRARVEGAPLKSAHLVVGEREYRLDHHAETLSIELELPFHALWWPHTHGEPVLHPCSLQLETATGEQALDLGRIGFRSIELDRTDGRVQFRVNGRPVFARGACWTATDIRSIDGAPGQTAATLRLARDGGLNMIRIGGTMAWGSDELYQSCDELGILVWQDLMLANMDYPLEDTAFRAEVEAELKAQLSRLQRHACIAVYCGGSEIEQQAAMLGLPASEWTRPFFTETLPALLSAHHAGVPCVRNTPTEGPLPFSTSTGFTHYYGVGAYRRPLHDVRLARVRFSPECLGFSNVPDAIATERLFQGALPRPHHPAWKAGVPRDAGAGWDFEDIRDHYLRALFSVDPVALRSVDPERYLALSRVVTGELMLRAFAEWRRPGSDCGGGLVWFLKDLRPGAGWGILDSEGRPKPVFHALRRAWARQAVLLTDEGLDGVALHILNETPRPLQGRVEIELLKVGRPRVALAGTGIDIEPFGSTSLSADSLLAFFSDIVHAYRFGPPKHDVVVGRLLSARGEVLHEDVLLPGGHALPMVERSALSATAASDGEGGVMLSLESSTFLQAVTIESADWEGEDDSFHLCPGRPRHLRFLPRPGARAFKVQVGALNLDGTHTVRGG